MHPLLQHRASDLRGDASGACYREGCLSYGIHVQASFRRVAEYVAKILNGAKPANLPVEQPTSVQRVSSGTH